MNAVIAEKLTLSEARRLEWQYAQGGRKVQIVRTARGVYSVTR